MKVNHVVPFWKKQPASTLWHYSLFAIGSINGSHLLSVEIHQLQRAYMSISINKCPDLPHEIS